MLRDRRRRVDRLAIGDIGVLDDRYPTGPVVVIIIMVVVVIFVIARLEPLGFDHADEGEVLTTLSRVDLD